MPDKTTPPALVAFFGDSADGTRLVGIGLCDEFLEQLKKQGAILQESKNTGSGYDVALFYEPTLNELVKKIRKINPDKFKVKLV